MSLTIEPTQPLFSFRHEAMATEFVCMIGGVEEAYATQAAQEAFRLFDDLELKLSLYRENSDVSRINLAPVGAEVRISEEAASCLELALAASYLTKERFNALLGAEACRAKRNLPSFLVNRATSSDCPQTGATLALDKTARFVAKLHDGGLLDLGGVGKGFALDRAMTLLAEEWEIPIVMLSSGGSTLLFRAPEREDPWRALFGGQVLASLSRGAVSSSGLGFQESHIIDPNTGESRTVWRRSYVRIAEAGLADALSTGSLLMSAEEIENLTNDLVGCGIAVEPKVGTEGVLVFGPFLEGEA